MVAEPIANFDLYMWVALGLFVVGIVATMVYDNTDAKSKHHKQRQLGTSSESE